MLGLQMDEFDSSIEKHYSHDEKSDDAANSRVDLLSSFKIEGW